MVSEGPICQLHTKQQAQGHEKTATRIIWWDNSEKELARQGQRMLQTPNDTRLEESNCCAPFNLPAPHHWSKPRPRYIEGSQTTYTVDMSASAFELPLTTEDVHLAILQFKKHVSVREVVHQKRRDFENRTGRSYGQTRQPTHLHLHNVTVLRFMRGEHSSTQIPQPQSGANLGPGWARACEI